jgi:carbon starvation protein
VHAANFTLPSGVSKDQRSAIAEVDPATMKKLAVEVGEKSLYGRTGGAATLAVGMASILSKVTHGRWLDLWYHFAIMFEALFILTTIDAGTRVGRYLCQDFLGKIHAPLGETRKLSANLLASLLMVCGWGFFLVQGVRDPDGGVKALWPIFGIANQMLAAIALCLATTILLKMQLQADAPAAARPLRRSPWLALVTLVPLVWLLAVTFSAGGLKIFHPDKGLGFWSAARAMDQALPGLEQNLAQARASNDQAAIAVGAKKVRDNRVIHFNNMVDAIATAFFLVLVSIIVLLSLREWLLLLARRRPAKLHETPPTWLPESALAGGRPTGWLGLLAFALLAAREWSGEAAAMRAQETAQIRPCPAPNCPSRVVRVSLLGKPAARSRGEIFAEMLEKRHGGGISRCC